ncbi:MAG: response regulator [Anaerolineae bacterium]|nr:response regulator [Anaerolineae bacterium]
MAEQQKRILIVEDDSELCEMLAQAVQDQSDAYDVKATRNVDEAMAQVRRLQDHQRAFDLVITDIKMAGLSGLELLEVLNSISPDTKTIAMTAYNSAELAERAQGLNVYAYLTKPFMIGEFRRIVQDALAYSDQSTADPLSRLSASHLRAVNKQLAMLRTMTGATTAFLSNETGSLLALDSLEPDTQLDNLSSILMFAHQQVAQQMQSDLGTNSPVRQSYFGTDAYSICTYQVDPSLFVGVIFGPAVKEGQVWYYIRDMVAALTVAVGSEQQTPPDSDKTSVKDELMAILDQYVPAAGGRRPSRRTTSAGIVSQATSQAVPPPVSTPSRTRAPSESAPPTAALPEPDIAVEDIDWNVGADADWDTMVSETAQGFGGLSLKQARQQGLVGSDIVSPSFAETEAAGPPPPDQGPPLDEIDWNASIDMDWEELVSTTDQGFGGISLNEAQQKGIIDGLEEN